MAGVPGKELGIRADPLHRGHGHLEHWPGRGCWSPRDTAGASEQQTLFTDTVNWRPQTQNHYWNRLWGYTSPRMPLLGVPPWRYQLELSFIALLIVVKLIKGAGCLGLCCGGKPEVEPVQETYWETCLTVWEWSENQMGHLSSHWSHQCTGASVPGVTVWGRVGVTPFTIFFLAAGSCLILPLSYFSKLLWSTAIFKYCAVHDQSVSIPTF